MPKRRPCSRGLLARPPRPAARSVAAAAVPRGYGQAPGDPADQAPAGSPPPARRSPDRPAAAAATPAPRRRPRSARRPSAPSARSPSRSRAPTPTAPRRYWIALSTIPDTNAAAAAQAATASVRCISRASRSRLGIRKPRIGGLLAGQPARLNQPHQRRPPPPARPPRSRPGARPRETSPRTARSSLAAAARASSAAKVATPTERQHDRQQKQAHGSPRVGQRQPEIAGRQQPGHQQIEIGRARQRHGRLGHRPPAEEERVGHEARRGEADHHDPPHARAEQQPRRLAAERHRVTGRKADDGDAGKEGGHGNLHSSPAAFRQPQASPYIRAMMTTAAASAVRSPPASRS